MSRPTTASPRLRVNPGGTKSCVVVLSTQGDRRRPKRLGCASKLNVASARRQDRRVLEDSPPGAIRRAFNPPIARERTVAIARFYGTVIETAAAYLSGNWFPTLPLLFQGSVDERRFGPEGRSSRGRVPPRRPSARVCATSTVGPWGPPFRMMVWGGLSFDERPFVLMDTHGSV